ncbi:uncharacterized protein Z520_11350 [Fonsecaea multimorphosa CBS 102226]|uniref:ERCC4 domain-containing protein n=1 Tax=Fonsecaea multimorphosa CBS 102226 TaxID=1442371 RepID=A0A0D2JQY1_9EURO|nr:uncharacterized protein Z520_11350 [Fonsecaea multimorphosa CBS 102226]KIX92874.1 hypothetical protein Z520_11350 [Fonsecaea multimorphosa CBS 102226]OAL18123.1 hypothetical protein AYO22_10900 [Fonsecaea multimorphosa]
MTEVIELLSSSPVKCPPARKTFFDDVDFDIDNFEVTGSIDFEINRPSKRKRTNPVVGSPSTLDSANVVPEIFSSDGSQGDSKLITSVTAFSRPSEPKKTHFLDDITFSSPALEPLTTHKRKDVDGSRRLPSDGFEGDLSVDDPFCLPQPMQTGYDHRTMTLLANLNPESTEETSMTSRPSKAKSTQNLSTGRAPPKIFDDIEFSSSPVIAKSTKPCKLPQTDTAVKDGRRAAEKTTARAERQALKEVEKEKRKLEREQKAKEKQKAADLAEVNKSRMNKKDATPEMILDMSSFLKDTSVGNQVEERMKNVQVEVNYVDEQVNLVDEDGEPVQHGSIATWRRKVKSTYNDEDDLWEPTSRCRIVNENHVLIHLPAADFVAMAATSRSGAVACVVREEQELKANLDAHVSSIRRRFGDCVPIYLIEGLRSWLRKSENAKNRAYTAAVRAQMLQTDGENSANIDPAPSQARSRKRKKPSTESMDFSVVTSDMVDDLLLHLQLAHQPILIHHTSTPADSAFQICAFTQNLSTRPYRLAQLEYNLKSASFCMDSGQVRTGDDPKDTFVKMLQEVQRVTPSMAYGIVEEYKSIRKLVKGFDKHGNLMLEDVRKTVNKDGGWSDKRLGPQISKRLYKVFMGRDPSSTDGMS